MHHEFSRRNKIILGDSDDRVPLPAAALVFSPDAGRGPTARVLSSPQPSLTTLCRIEPTPIST